MEKTMSLNDLFTIINQNPTKTFYFSYKDKNGNIKTTPDMCKNNMSVFKGPKLKNIENVFIDGKCHKFVF